MRDREPEASMEVIARVDGFFVDEIEDAEEALDIALSPRAKLYLIHLLKGLCGSADLFHDDIVGDRPLAVVLMEAIHKDLFARLRDLKAVGDLGLLFAGLYPDHLTRRLVDVDYFMMLGRKSYRLLSQEYANYRSKQELFALYSCLVAEFVSLIEVLTTISANLHLMDDTDLARAVRRWRRTGIDTYRRILEDRRIVPLAGPESA